MTKIKLTEGGFSLIPEGITVLKITAVEYKEDFGKLSVNMQTKSGAKHVERFSLMNAKGEINDGALKAFSYFAKTALNNYNLDEIDEQDLVGCYIKANVKHEEFESNREPGKMLKSARLSDYAVAIGFENSTVSSNEETSDEIDDLDDFLNE